MIESDKYEPFPSIKNRHVVLYSGGLDSFCLAHHVKPDVLVYFDIGLPEQQKEMESIDRLRKAGGLPAPIVFDKRFHLAPYKLPNEVMPFRNLYFLAGGFSYGDVLYLGKTASSRNLDKNYPFTRKALSVLQHVSHRPEGNTPGLLAENMDIRLPFDGRTKSQFLRDYLANGGKLELVLMTRSCYLPDGDECGACVSCVRKAIAFTNCGVRHNLRFRTRPEEHFQRHYNIAAEDGNLAVMEEVEAAMQVDTPIANEKDEAFEDMVGRHARRAMAADTEEVLKFWRHLLYTWTARDRLRANLMLDARDRAALTELLSKVKPR